jgi:3-hydroxyacyl-CoA dehydrogenase/enoyl-CoA hydratase/3-hydroxybutyryl-CoA epimerase
MTLKHWQTNKDAAGIFWLTLDVAGASANTLSKEVLEELEVVVRSIEADPPKALVILSGKEKGFIAGADVREFAGITTSTQAIDYITWVHSLYDRIEALTFPTVAAINGFCLGGGLELSLCCRYRIARADARIGLPEVRLGIFPGFGGSVRLTRLLPAPQAMELMLSGRILDARSARRAGVVDVVVEDRHFEAAVRAAAAGKVRVKRAKVKTWLMNSLPVRAVLAPVMRRKTAAKARPEHYPAPFALIDLWSRHGGSRDAMMREEANAVGFLVTGETARNLVRVFLLQERLKTSNLPQEPELKHVHVIGAGTMGGDIAAWCALQGMTVTLQDKEAKFIAPAIKRGWDLARRRARGRERDMMDRLTPDLDGRGVERADVIIEAIVENLEIKRGLFQGLEPRLKADVILGTNTSSIPLEEIAQGLKQRGHVVGIHFFNPVAQMPLVEIVHGEATQLLAAEKGAAFARAIDRLPLPVKSAPGFLVNRALMPYLLEAVFLLEEGASASAIDEAAEAFGMPMGPLEVSDRVGLDICQHVGDILTRELGGKMPARLRELVEKGDKGLKTGRGFYAWKNGKPQKPKATRGPGPDATDRLILSLCNACAACLGENVVSDPDMVDAGLIFGAGFAPFRGGPMNYALARGIPEVKQRLNELAERYGDRFKPVPTWDLIGSEAIPELIEAEPKTD